LKPNDGLFTTLHTLGKEGLRVFGYEPMRKLVVSDAVITPGGFICSSSTLKCDSDDTKSLASKLIQNGMGGNNVCKVYKGVDYKGGNEL